MKATIPERIKFKVLIFLFNKKKKNNNFMPMIKYINKIFR